MPKIKNLSGKKVISILESFGFVIFKQKGSHVKMVRSLGGSREVLTIPNHKELDKGTLRAIFVQATRFISENELRKFFYSD